jgi:tRNA (uracil-5-)-methyltransferase TRM9
MLDVIINNVDSKITAQIIALNSEFYQTFANQFSTTRMRLQPGVIRILEDLSPDENILDLGCGNGELARELIRWGHRGVYMGVDFSQELLDLARRGVAGHANFHFAQADLSDSAWPSQLIILHSQFAMITAFATLHHLPGRDLHLQILKNVRSLLQTEGRFVHSNWQFLNSEKLRVRIQPWSEIGLTDADIDPGDYLLDWRQGGRGLRYVHHFSTAELATLADETGFEIIDSFSSDGEGGNLGLYQIWKPKRKT